MTPWNSGCHSGSRSKTNSRSPIVRNAKAPKIEPIALPAPPASDVLFVFDLEPLWQPLFQGVILLTAVSLGALRLLKVSNRLDLFK